MWTFPRRHFPHIVDRVSPVAFVLGIHALGLDLSVFALLAITCTADSVFLRRIWAFTWVNAAQLTTQ